VNNGTNEHVLFYKNGGTLGIIGRFDVLTGAFGQEWSSSGFLASWTKIEAANSGYLLFYDGASGNFAIGTIATNGTFATASTGTGMLTNWSAIVPAGQTYLFFYRASDGEAAFGEYANGSFTTLQSSLTGFGTQRAVSSVSNGVVLVRNPTDGSAIACGFNTATLIVFNPASPLTSAALRTFPAGTFGTWGAAIPLGVL
jgi:hypothetical protein